MSSSFAISKQYFEFFIIFGDLLSIIDNKVFELSTLFNLACVFFFFVFIVFFVLSIVILFELLI